METAQALLHSLCALPSSLSDASSRRAYDDGIRRYLTTLAEMPQDARKAIISRPSEALETLDPAKNSVGYLFVLDLSRKEAAGPNKNRLWDQTIAFTMLFDPIQVRYLLNPFMSLLRDFSSGKLFPVRGSEGFELLHTHTDHESQPSVAVKLMTTAILRLDPVASTFTNAHLALAELAYSSNHVEAALDVLDTDILHFPHKSGYVNSQLLCEQDLPPWVLFSANMGWHDTPVPASILKYDLLRGLIYISRRDWAKAFKALTHVVTHPCKNKGISKIMVEAHKKWVLVGILHGGEEPSLPSYTNSMAQSNYQALNKPYMSLSDHFGAGEIVALRSHFYSNQQTWVDDGNSSLVAEVMAAYQKWQVVRLRSIYQRVSISQVRSNAVSAETGEPLPNDEATTAMLREMLTTGMLEGEIEAGEAGGEGYLVFLDRRAHMSDLEFAEEMRRSQLEENALLKEYKAANHRLTGTPEYVQHLVREQKRAEADKDADPALVLDLKADEEDLMTGVLAHG